MTHTTCYEKTAKPILHVYLHCNLCYSGDLLTALARVELKTHCHCVRKCQASAWNRWVL